MNADHSTALPDAAPTTVRYAYKPSLMGGMWEFELAPEALVWRVGRRSGRWAYDEIAAVRLRYRPQPIQSHAFRADIINARGQRVTLLSTTWTGIAAVTAQNDDYRRFLQALHQRLAPAGRARCIAGMAPLAYNVGIGVLAVVAAAMFGLMARAVASGTWTGVLFLVGFAAFLAWQFGNFMRRNRPGLYAPDALPPLLLP